VRLLVVDPGKRDGNDQMVSRPRAVHHITLGGGEKLVEPLARMHLCASVVVMALVSIALLASSFLKQFSFSPAFSPAFSLPDLLPSKEGGASARLQSPRDDPLGAPGRPQLRLGGGAHFSGLQAGTFCVCSGRMYVRAVVLALPLTGPSVDRANRETGEEPKAGQSRAKSGPIKSRKRNAEHGVLLRDWPGKDSEASRKEGDCRER